MSRVAPLKGRNTLLIAANYHADNSDRGYHWWFGWKREYYQHGYQTRSLYSIGVAYINRSEELAEMRFHVARARRLK